MLFVSAPRSRPHRPFVLNLAEQQLFSTLVPLNTSKSDHLYTFRVHERILNSMCNPRRRFTPSLRISEERRAFGDDRVLAHDAITEVVKVALKKKQLALEIVEVVHDPRVTWWNAKGISGFVRRLESMTAVD